MYYIITYDYGKNKQAKIQIYTLESMKRVSNIFANKSYVPVILMWMVLGQWDLVQSNNAVSYSIVELQVKSKNLSHICQSCG